MAVDRSESTGEWRTRGVVRQLEQARKLLAVLEEQGAAFSTLTIPAELQVNLENQRAKVAELEKRLAGGNPIPPKLKQAPEETGDRNLREIMDYLSLFCEPSLVEAVMKQVVLAPAFRRSYHWDMVLEPNTRRRRPMDEALNARLSYSFEQIASAHLEQEFMRSFAVYHVPSQLSGRGRLDRMRIKLEEGDDIDLDSEAVERYAERSAYGTFYRVPYSLRRGYAAKVSTEVSVYHPARSEEILVTYYPCTDYTATVRLPVAEARRFQLRVEFWHPSRSGEWMADEVTTEAGYQVSTYRISEPLLPYQGLRVAWHYQ